MLRLNQVISVMSCHLESKNDWFSIRLLNQDDLDNYSDYIKNGNAWFDGVHPSLFPDGFELVESGKLKKEYDRNLELGSIIAELRGRLNNGQR